MPAVPKRKLSKSRTARRRAHDALSAPQLVACPKCGEMMRPHYMCPNCRTYNGRQILPAEEE